MPINVTVRILGLAAVFIREGSANAVFLCDDVHPLEFSYPDGGGMKNVKLHEPDRDLELSFAAGKLGLFDNQYAVNSGRVFNMAAEYAHGPDRLRILRRRRTTDHVWMRVPTEVFGVSETTDNFYYVQEQGYVGAPVRIIAPVARDVILTFSFEERLVVAVTDPNDSTYRKEFGFDDSSGDIEFLFDNDCKGLCTENDFVNLYELLIDGSEEAERQFAAGQVKGDIPTARPAVLKPLGGIMSVNQGNCDPVGVIPPPGG